MLPSPKSEAATIFVACLLFLSICITSLNVILHHFCAILIVTYKIGLYLYNLCDYRACLVSTPVILTRYGIIFTIKTFTVFKLFYYGNIYTCKTYTILFSPLLPAIRKLKIIGFGNSFKKNFIVPSDLLILLLRNWRKNLLEVKRRIILVSNGVI